MAITRHGSQDYVMANSQASYTNSYTVGTGTNRILLWGTVLGQGANADDNSGVTYAGVSMAQIANFVVNGTQRIYLWGLLAPATGANFVVSSWSPTELGGWFFAADYDGVDQSALPSNVNTATTTATTLANTITVSSATSWVHGVGTNNAAQIAVDKGTLLANTQNVARANWDSNGTPGAGSYTLTWSDGGTSADWGGVIVELKAVATATAGRDGRYLSLLGAGQ